MICDKKCPIDFHNFPQNIYFLLVMYLKILMYANYKTQYNAQQNDNFDKQIMTIVDNINF